MKTAAHPLRRGRERDGRARDGDASSARRSARRGSTCRSSSSASRGRRVYSASETAREEFPDLDLTIRGAISIARRLQDPLAELVKVDPKIDRRRAVPARRLAARAEEAPRRGRRLGREPGRREPEHRLAAPPRARLGDRAGARRRRSSTRREKKGLFTSRDELLEVPRFSKKTFEQAAGFLRIAGRRQPARQHRRPPRALRGARSASRGSSAKELADLARAGRRTREGGRASCRTRSAPSRSTTSCSELEKPGRDPRETLRPVLVPRRDDPRAQGPRGRGWSAPASSRT